MPDPIVPQIVKNAFVAEHGFGLTTTLVMAAHVGSHAHGTQMPRADGTPNDVDLFMVVCPPPVRVLGFDRFDSWRYSDPKYDVAVFSIAKFVALLKNANPEAMCALWLRDEDYLYRHAGIDTWSRLIRERSAFSTKEFYHTITGFARGQYKRMRTFDLKRADHDGRRGKRIERFGYDTHQAAHVIRLLRMCHAFLLSGRLVVYRDGWDSDFLKAVKRGECAVDDVEREIRISLDVVDREFEHCQLPDSVSTTMVDRLMVRLYAGMWGISEL